mmetsp:Transcript_20826/g.45556  ORF Transcript_20826/g.45556 Transcript_20826/m.45556 type:complete len:147 (+) Transcript_20826:87-527(+)|eukprot:CAMPEP_0202893274 /NCGR_PEP_ID=MMETSP1392-20130828/2872_1 /ASSEMBLY_ACC=CAM_ASM_000868 /TAXON_ID=225041 /ORGANISM="Chlamydomonas chlamydogama, Strain SAG 11-48b" /LENGTH=146 /DNA_ID=CAMNT_0049577541 /DNA_START=87 /DNA_END=527 /DNA_ORIENTATION=-
MASVEELKDALKENLENRGVYKQLKAKIRSDIFKALSETEISTKPELSNENLVINELIREYLIFNGYRETLSVFLPESGQPQIRPFDRSFLAEHLNVVEGSNSQQLPLLYSLTAMAQSFREFRPAAKLLTQTASGAGTAQNHSRAV